MSQIPQLQNPFEFAPRVTLVEVADRQFWSRYGRAGANAEPAHLAGRTGRSHYAVADADDRGTERRDQDKPWTIDGAGLRRAGGHTLIIKGNTAALPDAAGS